MQKCFIVRRRFGFYVRMADPNSDDDEFDFYPVHVRALAAPALAAPLGAVGPWPAFAAAGGAAAAALAIVPAASAAAAPGSIYSGVAQRTAAQHHELAKAMRRCKRIRALEKKVEAAAEEEEATEAAEGDEYKWVQDIAFSGRSHRLTSCAFEFKRSRRDVSRAIKSGAMAWLQCQIAWMGRELRRAQTATADSNL